MSSELKPKTNASDHLANERTFLAWIRTSIGIIGFGFIVVKFTLFIRQIELVVGQKANIPHTGYSHTIGVLLVALGGLTILFSYTRYITTKKQIDQNNYYHSTLFLKIITALIFLISIALLFYVLKT